MLPADVQYPMQQQKRLKYLKHISENGNLTLVLRGGGGFNLEILEAILEKTIDQDKNLKTSWSSLKGLNH